jgi:hypothetical protein
MRYLTLILLALVATPAGAQSPDPFVPLENLLASVENDLAEAVNAARRARFDMDKVQAEIDELRLAAQSSEEAPAVSSEERNWGVIEEISTEIDFTDGELLEQGYLPKTGAPDVVGSFRTFCQTSHFAQVDPIVFPGMSQAGHLHRYMGNTLTDENSTYESLRASGESSCYGGRAYRTAIWAPVLFDQDDRIVDPDYTGLYYKRYPKDSPKCTELGEACADLPAGLEIIYGTNYAIGAQQDKNVRFDCAGRNLSQTIAEAAEDCQVGEKLRGWITGPNCWDGTRIAAPDHQSHLAYATRGRDTGQLRCPASHPLVIPTVSYFELYTLVEGDRPSEWAYSSDRMNGTPGGTTFHGDYFEAIEPDIRHRFHANCIDKFLSCVDGQLGDGTKLVKPDGFTFDAKPRLTMEEALAFGGNR